MTRAIVVKRSGAPVVLAAGSALLSSMTAQAKRSRDDAQSAATAAEVNAAYAESMTGPTYANTAAGLAATTDGQGFAVDNGDGTVTVYQNDSGSAVEQRTLATTAALASPTGGEMVGIDGGGSVQDRITIYQNTTLYTSQFASFSASLTAWAAQGGELVVDIDHSVPAPGGGVTFQAISLQLLANKEYILSSKNKRTISYSGATAVRSMLMILGANNAPLKIEGITWDANSKCNKPLFIDYQGVQGANRADIDVSGTFRNAHSSTAGWGDVSGVKIVGGFNNVYIHDVLSENISRDAGVTDPGSNGSTGITLFGSGLNNYRSAVIERCRIANITTLDLPDSPNYADMDGILAFQAIEVGARAPVIRDCTIFEAPGRGIKMYAPNPGSLAENIIISRSSKGVGNGMVGGPGHSVDIDFQHGDGIIRNVKIAYSGEAHYTKTSPIQVAQVNARTADNRLGPTIVEGITITDTTATGIKGCVVSVLDSVGGEARTVRVTDIVDAGKSETLIRTNKMGATARANVTLERIECDVSIAATQTSDTTPLLFVKGSDIVNRNSTVRPVKVTLAGTMSVLDWGDWVGNETVRGFARYTGGWRGMTGWTNGFRGPGGGVEAAPAYGVSDISGRVVVPAVTLADGATWTGPPVGLYPSNGGDFVFSLRILSNTYIGQYGRWSTQAGQITFTVLDAPPAGAIQKNDGGADTGTATKLEIWKSAADQCVRVTNNTGGSIRFQPVYNG